MSNKQFAFWKYDRVPFWRGGEITKVNKAGQVCTVEYGENNWFSPVLILPLARGRALASQLYIIERDYHTQYDALLHEVENKVKALIAEHTNPPNRPSPEGYWGNGQVVI